MTVHTVEGSSALEAWKEGAKLLLRSRGELHNLLTTISKPCPWDEAWLDKYSPSTERTGSDSANDVANTIFPYKISTRVKSRDELYEQYLRRHDRVRKWKRGRSAWGTYFERLVRFPPDGVNQLERAINKLISWPTRNTTGLVFHLSSPTIDPPRTRGGPCWHFGEILWNADGSLDLMVAYRNHDFFNKVLGNFVGLARLLDFVCAQSRMKPGRIVCHSVHAYFDSSQANLRALIK